MSAAEHSGSFARAGANAGERSRLNRAAARTDQGVQLLDGAALLEWVEGHAEAGSQIRQAIYRGLLERIRRGDFNAKEQR